MTRLEVGDKVKRVLPDNMGIWFGIGEIQSVKQVYIYWGGQCVTKQNCFHYSVLFNNDEYAGLPIEQLEKVEIK